jgi:beta-N-acetylhexosaminidase
MGQRATNDPKMAYEIARAVALQTRAVGFSWVHSPVLDVNTEPRNPEIYTRSYSDDAGECAEYALETCRGFKEGKVIATGKHFPGRGHSPVDAHFQVPVIDVDRETMMNRELLPYRKLIEADLLPSIMIAHSIFPAFDAEDIATVSKPILTGLLREELGFDGVITTDSMTMGAVATRYGVANACAMALEAGADLVLMKAENQLVPETIEAIRSFVNEGRITMEELDKKVYRVLNVKYEDGLFFDQDDHDVAPEEIFKDKAIVSLSKQVAKRSVLVCRDTEGYLPINPDERILVVEQKVGNYNNYRWHSGILFEGCLKYSGNVDYLETDYTWDAKDRENVLREIADYDTVVITNYYIRGKLCNKEAIEEIIASTGKKVIVVTNTPYEELSIPKNAKSVVITFATSPDNIEVVAGTLYGKINPEGVWPVSYHA